MRFPGALRVPVPASASASRSVQLRKRDWHPLERHLEIAAADTLALATCSTLEARRGACAALGGSWGDDSDRPVIIRRRPRSSCSRLALVQPLALLAKLSIWPLETLMPLVRDPVRLRHHERAMSGRGKSPQLIRALTL